MYIYTNSIDLITNIVGLQNRGTEDQEVLSGGTALHRVGAARCKRAV